MKLEKSRSRIAAALVLVLVGSGAWACKKSSAGNAAPAPAASEMAPVKKAASSGPGGGETPEAVVDRMKKAAADKNMPELVACLAPQARQEMSAAMYLGATMMVAFSQMGAEMGGAMAEGMGAMAGGTGNQPTDEDKKKMEEQTAKMKEELGKMSESYNSIMARHGLPTLPKEGEPEPAEPSKEALDKTFASIDHGAFITDVMGLLESMPGEKSGSAEEGPFELPQGALENLKIEGDKASGSIGGDPVTFVKIDGRWYLEGDPTGMGGPGAPEAVAP